MDIVGAYCARSLHATVALCGGLAESKVSAETVARDGNSRHPRVCDVCHGERTSPRPRKGNYFVAWLTIPVSYAAEMELRHLRYFVAVAELQNITRAAARLHVSQPPLSRQIRDLEDELGVNLFEHSAKALRLTEAGRVFLPEARAALQRVGDAVQTAKIVGTGQRGEIHVGYAPSLAVELLPRALKYFHESSPGVRVRLHDLSTQEMLLALGDGKLQVALLQ